MFRFPKEDFLRKKWIQAISRKDFAPSKYSEVCELHFLDDAIRRYTEGGNILGMAYNCEQAASSAYVFMIQSLLSSLKEVVHIMPVKKIDGEKLFVVKKTIVEFDGIGFKVIGVVSDNNSINQKAMSNFSVPPKLSFVYPHPSDSSNPLFFVIGSMHLFKFICNNWINQKNAGQCFYFPDFEDHNKFPLIEANFSKFAYGLTLKALCPTNLEKQNAKLVLKIFYNFVIQGLQLLGEQHKLISYETTSICISLICTSWKIVNVKTPLKGQHLLDPYQQPITLSPVNQTCEFLHKILSCRRTAVDIHAKKTKTVSIELDIALTVDEPIFHKPRRLPFAERDIVDAQVDEWVKNGIVEPRSSPYASQVVVVKKKDGKSRVCIDYRRLNRKFIKDSYPLPLIDDILDCLQNAKIFTTLDLKNGFFHVAVNERSRKFTSFVTHNGQYQFRRMPFGLSTCPSNFMRYINAIFRHMILKSIVLPYMDDVVIPAANVSQALEYLKIVLEVACDYGLEINF
ncbi:retrovirus-related Pol polyprotein from transposon opus [Trichonephila clavipes]|nr:retrovirus-related Pol polyprotein from transposon opus [Trichonephila clavipes]